ncbi:unnamed protein product [Ostreobium quekettii]|uniref:Non-canonical E2 ubiquitin-conjugating enzyme C-terminal domain-containing protein n=1 Tax=Ostreobium quekettii TaxID=121088 RepID=A0A8S1J5T7_9CHLO|nr:unnamed protein product [Ostreobium quekettii]|eukprot:evm.model.scf_862.4 EVM.evm.TU.scf_862.4   scf_862:32324-41782(-)
MPKMTGARNEALAGLLDADEEGPLGEDDGLSKVAYEEHMARVQAEADAQDKARRLAVAQQQLAEYAAQKEEDAAALLRDAQALARSVGGGQEGGEGLRAATGLGARVEALKNRLAQAAAEAKAYAAQHREDMERSKRSSAQADLPSDDVDMKRPRENGVAKDDEELSDAVTDSDDEDSIEESTMCSSSSSFAERCKYIPLRLSYEERNKLRLLEAALNVSEYTDKVDILSWERRTARVHKQIQKICSILSGLVVAQDYRQGQRLIQSREFCDNARYFQTIFEIGRRYKIMNPDKMRAEYGKMTYMLMDSTDDNIQELLEFRCVAPLKTVSSLLKEKNALQMLQDPMMERATAEIVASDRPRYEIQRDIKAKERAREVIAQKYSSRYGVSRDDILLCLYSISDNNSFLLYNRDPVDRMIKYLTTFFKPDSYDPGFSLSISAGSAGARLSHSHERQYHYVHQTLTLWREISNDMFKLWFLADLDLLDSENCYRLTDTGQGLNRVQQAPRVRKAVFEIIDRCQRRIGHWVGSSVVHLGDHNVPNALMFIDKYTQVPRILNPVVLALEEMPKLYRTPHLRQYIDNAFGSLEDCIKTVLVDFFRHAFDGSGADNFFDAGSCIDGRLTSAWNWCNKIEKKDYHHIFKLAGLVGFDGDFK